MIDPELVRSLITDLADGPLVETEWLCDVMDANAYVIGMHIRSAKAQGGSVESKFEEVSGRPRRLRDLLLEDYRYLSRGQALLAGLESRFEFLEIAGPNPNAYIISAEESGIDCNIVCFRSPMLYFLHSGYSKVFILTHNARHADCLLEHEALMNEPTYSDTSLLAGLFNDIETLFDQRYLSLPISPIHLADPFDYCERVEGTRRFILCHEIGHALYASRMFNDWARIDESLLPDKNVDICHFLAERMLWDEETLRMNAADALDWADDVVRRALQLKLDASLSSGWAEELWCDSFSLQTILRVYGEEELDGPPLYELESALIGILEYFTLMDIVEVVLRANKVISATHPPPLLRREALRNAIKQHPLYGMNEKLRHTLSRNWKSLNGFRMFAGGANAPFVHSDLWSTLDFQDQLTDFGRSAYRALFDATVHEAYSKSEFGRRVRNTLQEAF
jgi:hypothetical protein